MLRECMWRFADVWRVYEHTVYIQSGQTEGEDEGNTWVHWATRAKVWLESAPFQVKSKMSFLNNRVVPLGKTNCKLLEY